MLNEFLIFIKDKPEFDTDLEKITTEINKSIEANNNKLIFNTEELECKFKIKLNLIIKYIDE